MRRPVYRSSYRSSFKPRSIRHSESRAKRRLIFTLAGILIATFVFFMWGLPFIIGQLSFLNKRDKPIDASELKIDEAIAPPVLYIPFEATNSATLPISGYAAPLSKVDIYIDGEIKSQTSADTEGKFTSDPISLNLGTNNIHAVTISDSDKKSLPSKNIKLYFSNEKPTLEISEPADGTEIKGGDKKVKVAGKTDENNSVTVNGSTVIVDNEGNFQTVLALNDGDNTITVIASNSFSNSNQMERKVKYTQDAAPSPSPSP